MYGADLTWVADGIEAATISVQLRDEYGNDIAKEGVAISFASTGGTLSATTVITDPSGFAQVTLTSTSVEEVEVTAAVDLGGPVASAITNGSPVRVNFVPGEPASLRFVDQPAETVAGEAITPAVTVEVLDAYENRVTGYTDMIKVALGNDAGNPDRKLQGTLAVHAAAGLATFRDLFIEVTGTGYTLIVQDAAAVLDAVESDPFTVVSSGADPPKAPSKLLRRKQPSWRGRCDYRAPLRFVWQPARTRWRRCADRYRSRNGSAQNGSRRQGLIPPPSWLSHPGRRR